ncbi:hypothetical protein E4T66_15600 [Sinimarinibacterium sp. CAU 1509]|uniref:hypothetical protein n=1 Tax=Sinimarinibacterium sp. CAU 1509 TaxID=2562283 RepID=UPI0010ABCA56|nr:hypothetical protein [Sinimarinibacterium sp. CAU 1509]TJY59007.1 hypothetical protein E4T66_15600 [Sinimarinibacterium sp. CAU 1509]
MRRVSWIALLLLSACAAPRPVLYPNATMQMSGQGAADAAVAECRRRADASNLDSSQGRVVKGAAGGAVAGALIGAAVGSVSGNAGKGAQYGAAGGAAQGGVHGLFRGKDPGPVYKAYVNRCLSESGYEVIGWQ